MSTNEFEEQAEPTRAEVLRTFLGEGVAKATDTGPTTGISLRVWLLLAVLAVIVSIAVFPANVIGSVALLALALTLASRVRGTRP